jgi:hypothetical protein
MRAMIRVLYAAVVLASLVAAPASRAGNAPTDRPPNKGGYTYSLGMPSLYKPFAGFEMQSYATGDNGQLGGLLNLGANKDLGNPIVGAAALGVEGYGGYRGRDFDGGGRVTFSIPSLLLGAGVDYNITDDSLDFLARLDLTARRGGIFGNGTTLAIRYLPAREHTFSVGVNVPLWGKHLGRSRAKRDHVVLDDRSPERISGDEFADDGALVEALDDLRERIRWVTSLTQPFAEIRGGDASAVMTPVAEEIAAHIAITDERFPDGHTIQAEIRAYHETLERAFALALSDGLVPGAEDRAWARDASEVARKALLEEVLLPYNRLIGQYKKHDSLYGMISVAQSRFGREVLTSDRIPPEAIRRVWLVFQTLCDHLEDERKHQRERWEDSRFVWLPLQLALKPEQHDSQADLDAILELAVEQEFTPENRIWYVVNESFQWEMARTVRLTRDYHVLWIHDYRGENAAGEPDLVALAQTVNYLDSMTERVLEYDDTAKFPTYLIVIDQHFFEINDGRRFLRVLENPLEYELDLPDEYADWEQRVAEAQQRLRDAVEGSRLLRLESSQYGDKWLKNYIRVHVNITNQADPSFYSLQIAGFIPVPDNNMRDHRKIALYDITEEDPYRGLAMFTGMGIGEHYAGANWEDRAIMIKGPGALEVKTAARELLETQGFEREQMPWALRPVPRGAGYHAALAAQHEARTPDFVEDRGDVMQIHSETGFYDKPIEVAKAVLYSLMPPGSVIQVPDSLWQNYLYASLLAGSSLRGCRVLIVSPALEHAPAGGAANMARAHDLMARLIVFENTLGQQIEDAGGVLAIGLYAPRQDVGDISGRYRQAVDNNPSWLRRVFPMRLVEGDFGAMVDSVLAEVGYVNSNSNRDEDNEKPKLHLKANFFASADGWNLLMSRGDFAPVALEHVRYMAEQSMIEANATLEDLPDIRSAPDALREAWFDLIEKALVAATPEERDQIIYYFTVGSVNLDYRSMVLNAETMIVVTSWSALNGFMDFLLLPGLCEWVDSQEELDALLPPPSSTRRWISNFIRILL